MTKRQLHLLRNRSQVKVITSACDNQVNLALLVTSAFAFAGVFFFIGETLWHALTGG